MTDTGWMEMVFGRAGFAFGRERPELSREEVEDGREGMGWQSVESGRVDRDGVEDKRATS